MTPADVASRVAAIRTLERTDHLGAVAQADQLRIDVLQEIANGNIASIALARGVLTTVNEDIGRD